MILDTGCSRLWPSSRWEVAGGSLASLIQPRIRADKAENKAENNPRKKRRSQHSPPRTSKGYDLNFRQALLRGESKGDSKFRQALYRRGTREGENGCYEEFKSLRLNDLKKWPCCRRAAFAWNIHQTKVGCIATRDTRTDRLIQ